MATLISNLTSFADQTSLLRLSDGSVVTMELIYQGASERWIMNLSYGTHVINGIGVCCLPNIIRQWRNVLPFGIACVTNDQTDPFDISDFANGRALLYLLTQEDVTEIESSIFGRAIS